ncbi:hypothetical protein [Vibrio coralliirubri]|uniref:hypothetical protein n=1 Tax=Vibrio coralliirubri TaxID=1516159 RepID=UPI0022834A1C|nr:hypothetical protein [Vibrio coralliirubri]
MLTGCQPSGDCVKCIKVDHHIPQSNFMVSDDRAQITQPRRRAFRGCGRFRGCGGFRGGSCLDDSCGSYVRMNDKMKSDMQYIRSVGNSDAGGTQRALNPNDHKHKWSRLRDTHHHIGTSK